MHKLLISVERRCGSTGYYRLRVQFWGMSMGWGGQFSCRGINGRFLRRTYPTHNDSLVLEVSVVPLGSSIIQFHVLP